MRIQHVLAALAALGACTFFSDDAFAQHRHGRVHFVFSFGVGVPAYPMYGYGGYGYAPQPMYYPMQTYAPAPQTVVIIREGREYYPPPAPSQSIRREGCIKYLNTTTGREMFSCPVGR